MFLHFRKDKKLDDAELILKYKKTEDKRLVGILFQRYTHLVFGVCMKYLKDEEDSKDQTMMIFEGLIQKLLEHDITNFKSWLHTLVRNHCLMYLRKKNSLNKKHDGVVYQDHMENDAVPHLLNGDSPDNVAILEKAMVELKEEQRQCIQLFYLQNKSYKEIVDITGYSLNEVKSYIQNGKRNLKILIENNK